MLRLTASVVSDRLIRSFPVQGDRETLQRQLSRKFGNIGTVARRKLRMLEDAEVLSDMAALREAVSRPWAATGKASTVFASTINGGFASSGAMERPKGSRSSIISSEASVSMANNHRLPPIHPGEILREEFLSPLGMSAHQLALALRVPATRINDIVNEKRGITADTALRLSRYFGTTPRFWMNIQASWELETAEDELGNAVRREVLPRTA